MKERTVRSTGMLAWETELCFLTPQRLLRPRFL
jgi:hypothetical protein